jgi:hypothetical protein
MVAVGVALTAPGIAAEGATRGAGLVIDSGAVIVDNAKIAVDGDRFSVEAAETSLGAILEALAEHADFRLVLTEESRKASVTVALEDQAWRSGLRELLYGWHYALIMGEGDQVPLSLVLMSRREQTQEAILPAADQAADAQKGEETVAGSDDETSLEEATRIAQELHEKRVDPFRYDLRRARTADSARAQVEGGGHDAEQTRQELDAEYARRLERLGRYQGDEKLEVLAPALTEGSGTVRTAALRALRDGTVQDLATLSDVREMALSDSDYSVRREAFEVYVRYGDQDDVLSMAQELGREAGPLQDIAVREWVRIEQERASAADPQQAHGQPPSQ